VQDGYGYRGGWTVRWRRGRDAMGGKKLGEVVLYLQGGIKSGQSRVSEVDAPLRSFRVLEQQEICCRICRGESSNGGGVCRWCSVAPCQLLKAARRTHRHPILQYPPPRDSTSSKPHGKPGMMISDSRNDQNEYRAVRT
jgi:hypothetical protein